MNKKRTEKGISLINLIIIIVLILVIGSIGIWLVINNLNKNNENNNYYNNNVQGTNNNNLFTSKNNKISQIYVFFDRIIALTENSDLYVMGKESYEELGLGESDEVTKPKLIASNVKKVIAEYSRTYYIDENDNLYMAGLYPLGGVIPKFKKICDNVKDVSGMISSVLIVNKNNEVLAFGGSEKSNLSDSGLSKEYEEITVIKESNENIIDIVCGYNRNSYLTDEGNVYTLYEGEDDYELTISNVKKITENLILTNNNELYAWDSYDKVKNEKIVKVDEEVKSIGSVAGNITDEFYLKNDGEIYKLNLSTNKGDNYFEEGDEDYSLKPDSLNDADDILIRQTLIARQECFVYINEEEKIVIKTLEDTIELENNIDSLKDLYSYLHIPRED